MNMKFDPKQLASTISRATRGTGLNPKEVEIILTAQELTQNRWDNPGEFLKQKFENLGLRMADYEAAKEPTYKHNGDKICYLKRIKGAA